MPTMVIHGYISPVYAAKAILPSPTVLVSNYGGYLEF